MNRSANTIRDKTPEDLTHRTPVGEPYEECNRNFGSSYKKRISQLLLKKSQATMSEDSAYGMFLTDPAHLLHLGKVLSHFCFLIRQYEHTFAALRVKVINSCTPLSMGMFVFMQDILLWKAADAYRVWRSTRLKIRQ